MASNTKPNVLIAGASIGGPVLAYWLVKAGCSVTVVERSPQLQTNGASIDIRNDGVRIMRLMGIEKAVRAKVTGEAGLDFVNGRGSTIATMPATGVAESQSMTSEFEIFRGDLAKIVFDATQGEAMKDKIKYIFGDYIKSITQNEKARTATVEFHHGTPSQTFDLVVGCDGLSSKTRAMAFNTDVREHIKPLNAYTAFYTIERDLLNGSQSAKVYNTTRGRSIMMRPDPRGYTRVLLNVVGPSGQRGAIEPFLKAEKNGGYPEIKKVMADHHRDSGWIAEELLQGMADAKDFYSGELAQVYAPTLSRGRIVLVGDAGYCPSPISGSGTTCAFVGAYVLAGEVSKSLKRGEDLDEALKRYDAEMIPRARKCQKLIPGTPALVHPQTLWGLFVMRAILAVLSFSRLFRVFEKFSGLASFGEGSGLPDYEWNA